MIRFEATHKDLTLPNGALLIRDLDSYEGKEVIKGAKHRVNQQVFRRKILEIYGSTCCITGLTIPGTNVASHIIPWQKRPDIRLDPRNGLCLSGTYDAAFDRHLISLDDDYRIILSTEIRDYFNKTVNRDYFEKVGGNTIKLPLKFSPSQEWLAEHRADSRYASIRATTSGFSSAPSLSSRMSLVRSKSASGSSCAERIALKF